MLKLATTHCPKCKVIETKLFLKGIPFETIEDMDEITKLAESVGMNTAPLLVLDDGTVLDFVSANKYISSQEV